MAADQPGSVLLRRAASRQHAGRSMLFRDPVNVIETYEPQRVHDALAAVEEALAAGLFVAGYVSYEAGLALEPSLSDLSATPPPGEPLLWLGCYRAPEVREEDGQTPAQQFRLPGLDLRFGLSSEEYTRKVHAVRELIAAGDTYQANLTMDVRWQATETAAEMYQRLFHAQPVPYTALLHPKPGWQVISCSPELWFSREDGHIVTRPMKGTATPGLDMNEVRANAAWLQADPKNRAENVMIVDLLRNDLGRICEVGSVKVTSLFDVERYPTVLQMTSTVEGQLRADVSYSDIFKALFPSGSIVGAPKINTMRLLHAIEGRPRGVYTGAIGYIVPNRVAEFNVAIRTVSLHGDEAHFGVGSGIVYDSEPALEYAECRTKVSFLTREPERPFELIETLLLERGSYILLEEHLERMAQSAEYFDMPFGSNRAKAVLDEATRAHADNERIRVRLLMGQDGTFTWTASGLGEEGTDPISLVLATRRTDPTDRFLRHKTTNRDLYDEGFRQAQRMGCADSLFCNVHDELTESAIHNVVVSIGSQWFTPPLSSGVLPGVYRRRLLEQGRLMERVLTLADLRCADAVYVCNSVRRLRRVRGILQKSESEDALSTVWEDPTSGNALIAIHHLG